MLWGSALPVLARLSVLQFAQSSPCGMTEGWSLSVLADPMQERVKHSGHCLVRLCWGVVGLYTHALLPSEHIKVQGIHPCSTQVHCSIRHNVEKHTQHTAHCSARDERSPQCAVTRVLAADLHRCCTASVPSFRATWPTAATKAAPKMTAPVSPPGICTSTGPDSDNILLCSEALLLFRCGLVYGSMGHWKVAGGRRMLKCTSHKS